MATFKVVDGDFIEQPQEEEKVTTQTVEEVKKMAEKKLSEKDEEIRKLTEEKEKYIKQIEKLKNKIQ